LGKIESMPMVKVYQFEVWDGQTGRNVKAMRMATRECIKKARGTVIERTEREVDASMVNAEGLADISIQPDL
jgi:hypothetical protein